MLRPTSTQRVSQGQPPAAKIGVRVWWARAAWVIGAGGSKQLTDYLMEIPLEDGQHSIVVQVDAREVPKDDLVLASPQPGEIVARARRTLESALEEIEPGIRAVARWAERATPQEYTVEFGLKLGGQTTVILATGSAEVNFVVKMAWKR